MHITYILINVDHCRSEKILDDSKIYVWPPPQPDTLSTSKKLPKQGTRVHRSDVIVEEESSDD